VAGQDDLVVGDLDEVPGWLPYPRW